MFERLFSPIQIRGLELRNRVVMSAMGTLFAAASEDHRSVTEKLINYHVARARGGCGLNTVEVCAVDMASSPKGFLSIADDRYISGLRKLTDAVHEAGGAVAVQLWQAVSTGAGDDVQGQILVFEDLRMDTAAWKVWAGEELLHLTPTEFAILKQLMARPSQVITKARLLDAISLDTPDCTEGSLKIHISHLRRKLKRDTDRDYIEAVWGIGFKMRQGQEEC